MNENNFLQELSTDLGELFSSGHNYDVIIQTEENGNIKEFYTHSLILCLRSPYFKTALSKNWAYNEDGIIIFKKPNILPEIMNLLLKYLYSGTIELDKQKGINVFKLFMAADELDIKKLSDYILNYITKKCETFIKDDPIDILQIIFQYEPFNYLRNYCLELIEMILKYEKSMKFGNIY
ncbi:BTB/POZ protein [Glomus cerebriforme]|uniref:BTB/POZ protein n=1 Tax=Glomus cerebriforme TaxID=658196 RepID=A0A397T3B7_9GLOM|nr:BTB/POZ protein [Glomus cerebriforme]